jgi:hypothetical protein
MGNQPHKVATTLQAGRTKLFSLTFFNFIDNPTLFLWWAADADQEEVINDILIFLNPVFTPAFNIDLLSFIISLRQIYRR